jgi:EpsI family protein
MNPSSHFLGGRDWLTGKTVQFCCLALLLFFYYGPTIWDMVNDWRQNSTFSYAFLVPVITVFLLSRKWEELKSITVSPSIWASIPLASAVLIAAAGHAMGDSFSMRTSMILALGSLVWLMFGREMLKKVLFPLFYLSLMIPAPYVLIKDLTFYLRYSDANHAANLVQLLGIPVYRESYFLHIPNMTLKVADVCSGVSSVFALFALGVIYAHFLPLRFIIKCLLVGLTFPFAIIANLFRIVLTVILAYNFGLVVFQTYFHSFSGMFTFVIALLLLIAAGEVLKKRFPLVSASGLRVDQTVRDGRNRGNTAAAWGSFVFGAVILSSAMYFSAQLSAAPANRLMLDLKTIESNSGYQSAGSMLRDSYTDPNADIFLSQTFVGHDGSALDVFVGYRAEQKEGIRLRSPRLYFPEKWNSAWLEPAELTIDGMTTINGNWMLARRGDSAELVIYWYQIASRTYAGEFEYRVEQLRRSLIERRSDAAVVRIATPLRTGESLETAQARLQTFGSRLYQRLAQILPQ